jgi:hypothetical protein
VDTEFPVKLDLIFPDRKAVQPDLIEEDHKPQFATTNLSNLIRGNKNKIHKSRHWVDPKTREPSLNLKTLKEEHVFLRVTNKPGHGVFMILWPRSETEALPTVSRTAEGVLKITHREGTDYVFLGREPFEFRGKGIHFKGRAGAIRVRKDHAILSLTEGTGSLSYGEKMVMGIAPFERRVDLGGKGSETIAPPIFAIQLPTEPKEDVIRHSLDEDVFKTLRPAKGVTLEGYRAAIEIRDESIRFTVPEARYAKLIVGNVGIRGLGPFDLTFTPTGISGVTEGSMRTLVTTWPEQIQRPMFHLDGKRWYAGWADDPSIGKGTKTPQFALAFAVTGGRQRVEVAEWTFPNMPPMPQRRVIGE